MIILSRRAGTWCARFTGERAATVKRLFYSDTLATPFGAAVPGKLVVGVIRGLNADQVVVVREEGGRRSVQYREIRTHGHIIWPHLRFGLPASAQPLARAVTFGFWLARRRMVVGAVNLARAGMEAAR